MLEDEVDFEVYESQDTGEEYVYLVLLCITITNQKSTVQMFLNDDPHHRKSEAQGRRFVWEPFAPNHYANRDSLAL